jgi:HEAT repeat protein
VRRLTTTTLGVGTMQPHSGITRGRVPGGKRQRAGIAVVAVVAVVAALAIGACGPPPPPLPPPPPPPVEPELPAEGLAPEVRAYVKVLHERIHPRWTEFLEALRIPKEPWYSDPKLEALVAISIDPTGRPAGVWLAQGSQAPRFDLRAVQVVLESSPFPPPPATMRSDDGFARLVWRFARGAHTCSPVGVALQRERWELSRILPLLATQRRYEDARIRIEDALDRKEAGPEVARAYARALLWAHLHEADRDLRVIATLGLSVSSDPEAHEALRHLVAAEAELAPRAVRALGRIADREDAEVLVRTVKRNDGLASVEAAPLAARLGRGADVVKALEPSLMGSDALARARALRALARLDDVRTLPLLLRLAQNRDLERDARLRAIEALGRTRSEEAARALAKLDRELDGQIRAAALVAMARTGRLRARAQVLAHDRLKDPSPSMRAAAAVALISAGEGPGAWRGRLSEYLRYADTPIMLAAVDALQAAGGADAVRFLTQLREQGRLEVRAAAAAALSKLAPKSATPARLKPTEELQRSRDRAALATALASPDLGLACAAAQGLAAAGLDLDAARALVRRMNSGSAVATATIAAALLSGTRFECPSAEADRDAVGGAPLPR